MSGLEPTALRRRVVSAVLLSAAAMLLIWLGTLPFAVLCMGLGVVSANEFFAMVEKKGFHPCTRLGTALILAMMLAAALGGELALSRVFTLAAVAVFVTTLFRPGRRVSAFVDGALTMLAVLYLGWMFSYLLLVRRLPDGAGLVTMLVCASAFTDIGGYFVGRTCGRHQLWPAVSPKKTVEGAVGGLFLAMLACWIAGALLGIAPVHRVCAAVLVSLVGQVGDLWESAVKREVGVKDSGTAIAGHGGALDRFDSLAFAAPLFYFYVLVFMR